MSLYVSSRHPLFYSKIMLPDIPHPMYFCMKNPHTPEKLANEENNDTVAMIICQLPFKNLTVTTENSTNSQSKLAFESGHKCYQTLSLMISEGCNITAT